MSALFGWLCTYFVHSTILLGLAWLADVRLRGRPHLREPVWRAALVGGLLTATAQTTLGVRPWAGTWTIAGEASVSAPVVADSSAPSLDIDATVVAPLPQAMPVTTGSPVGAPSPAKARAMKAARVVWRHRRAVLGAWALGAGVLFTMLGCSWMVLHARLRDRRRLDGEPIEEALFVLAERSPEVTPPRLTASSRVAVPMAMGLLHPEICLSERVVTELSREAQESLLAHELGHTVRRDPLFRLLSSIIARAFFFQPLNWLAARRLSACAELLADDWAARRTARPLDLAECLTKVARWAVSPVRGLPVAAAIMGPSDLKQRVQRLLRGDGLTARGQRPIWAALCSLLTAFTLLAPSACGGAPKPPSTAESAHHRERHAVKKNIEVRVSPAAEEKDTEGEEACTRPPLVGREARAKPSGPRHRHVHQHGPNVDVDVDVDLDGLQASIDRDVPSNEEIQKLIQKELKRARKQMRQQIAEARRQMRDSQRDMEKAKRDQRDAMKNMPDLAEMQKEARELAEEHRKLAEEAQKMAEEARKNAEKMIERAEKKQRDKAKDKDKDKDKDKRKNKQKDADRDDDD